jgi:hypothetical protein
MNDVEKKAYIKERTDEINTIMDGILKEYGLGIDETSVSENLIEIKIIPLIVRKPRKIVNILCR